LKSEGCKIIYSWNLEALHCKQIMFVGLFVMIKKWCLWPGYFRSYIYFWIPFPSRYDV